jgi:uncharacterized protein (DUF3084 family)
MEAKEMSDHDMNLAKQRAAAQQRRQLFLDRYAAGQPLFSRATISDLDMQIDSAVSTLHIKDFLGEEDLKFDRIPPWVKKE